MLNDIFLQKKNYVSDLNSELMEHIHNSEKIDESFIATGARRILSECQAALEHAGTGKQYSEILNLAGAWKFFLDSRQIRHDFQKPERSDLFSETFIKPSKKADFLSGSGLHFWSSGKAIIGIALRDSFDRTVPISVERTTKHPKTGKIIRRSKTFLVHDEFNKVSEGDKVLAYECRPISKRKNFMLSDIL